MQLYINRDNERIQYLDALATTLGNIDNENENENSKNNHNYNNYNNNNNNNNNSVDNNHENKECEMLFEMENDIYDATQQFIIAKKYAKLRKKLYTQIGI